MQISWNGLSSFVIKGKPIQGDVALVTDPYQNEVGLRFPRTLSAAVVVQSHDSTESNNAAAISHEDNKSPFLITHAGEYEVQGIFITGINAPKKDETPHAIYRIRLEDINIGFLGQIDRKLTDQELEKLGDIDVLIIPVGGDGAADKDLAADIVSQVEPRMVIPSYFSVKGLKKKLATVDSFCKELSCPMEEVNKLKLTKSALPTDEINIRVLSRG